MGQFNSWGVARREGSDCATSPRSTWPPTIRTHPGSAPTVKQHVAAIRMLGDWLVVSQVLPVNPAAAVRGPKHVVTKGATPVLSPVEARKLLESIDTGALAGLRPGPPPRGGGPRCLRRGGRPRGADGGALPDRRPGGAAADGPGARRIVLAMIKRRAAAAGLPPSTCCHTFRATGITAYLSNGGTLVERAQQIAGHASPKTTCSATPCGRPASTTRSTSTTTSPPGLRDDRPSLDSCLRALRKGGVLVVLEARPGRPRPLCRQKLPRSRAQPCRISVESRLRARPEFEPELALAPQPPLLLESGHVSSSPAPNRKTEEAKWKVLLRRRPKTPKPRLPRTLNNSVVV